MRVANASVQPASQAFMLSIFDADILEERIMKLTQKRRQLGLRVGRAIFVTAFTILCLSALTISTFSFDLRTHASALDVQTVAIQSTPTQSAAKELPQEPNSQDRSRSDQMLNSASPQERAQAAQWAVGKVDELSDRSFIAEAGPSSPRQMRRQIFHRKTNFGKTNFAKTDFASIKIMPCIPSDPCSSLILCGPQIINCPNGRHQAPRADRRTDRTRAPFREFRE